MKKIILIILIFISLFISGCTDEFNSPNLVVDEIKEEISRVYSVPVFIGYVKNTGNETAEFSEIRISAFRGEDKDIGLGSNYDYLGSIKPGERKRFEIYFWIDNLIEITDYEVKLEYE